MRYLSLFLLLSAAPLRVQDLIAAEMARFHGTWLLVGSSSNGQTADVLPEGVRQAWSDTTTVTINGQTMMEATFRIDPTVTPHAIDYLVLGGPMKGAVVPGVYRFEGERLTVCVGGPGGSRPTDFVADQNEAGWCSVWEKT